MPGIALPQRHDNLLGLLFAQLVIGVVGVLAFSGEYGTGMIRATLAVVSLAAARAVGEGDRACLCGYAVVLTGLAAWRLRRRDA